MKWLRWLNLKNISASVQQVWSRFGLTLACCYVLTLFLLYYVDNDMDLEHLMRSILAIGLAVMTTWVAKVAIESHKLSSPINWIVYAVSLILPVVYWWGLPEFTHNTSICYGWITLGLYLVCALAIFVVPYFRNKGSDDAYVTYSYDVVLSLAQALFFGLVFWLSLSLALIALDKLFGIDVKGVAFYRLFISIAGFFCTTYFLSIFPKDYEHVQTDRGKGLQVLGSYVLAPVVWLYALILYAYIFKVLLDANGAEPWVKYLITWFLLLGLITYLFNQYTSQEQSNRIASWYSKTFFPISIPLSILLLYTMYTEYQSEGITEENYLLSMLATWMLCLAIYMTISRIDNNRWITRSLLAMVILAFFSPWNICRSVVNSQTDRLESMLTESGHISNGQLRSKEISTEINNISNTLDALHRYQELDRVRNWDKTGILEQDTLHTYDILKTLNITTTNGVADPRERSIYINNQWLQGIDISPYDSMYPLLSYVSEDDEVRAYMKDMTLYLPTENGGQKSYDLSSYIAAADEQTKQWIISDASSEIKIIINHMSIQKVDDQITSLNIDGFVLYKSKVLD